MVGPAQLVRAGPNEGTADDGQRRPLALAGTERIGQVEVVRIVPHTPVASEPAVDRQVDRGCIREAGRQASAPGPRAASRWRVGWGWARSRVGAVRRVTVWREP